jgi:hypothetical protein
MNVMNNEFSLINLSEVDVPSEANEISATQAVATVPPRQPNTLTDAKVTGTDAAFLGIAFLTVMGAGVLYGSKHNNHRQ